MKLEPILAILGLLFSMGCSISRGRPGVDSGPFSPDHITEFATLYQQNCAGCHGADGKGGAAMALANPVFLAISDDDVVRRTIQNGVPSTAMPAFSQSSGGMLTEKQIDALVRGIRSWANPDALTHMTPPAYAPKVIGNAQTGAKAFQTYCACCHGIDARGSSKASSIVDGSFLSLVSDRYLRTVVIAGRPELGAPDWRNDVEGRPMSDQEVTDVVAWLSSQRPIVSRQPSAITFAKQAEGVSQ